MAIPHDPKALASLPGEDGTPDSDWLPAPRPSKGLKSFAFQKAVRDAEDLTSSERLVLFVLSTYARHRGSSGTCWPSIPTLAKGSGMSLNTVRAAIRHLEELGWLTVRARAGPAGTASHEYSLHVPARR